MKRIPFNYELYLSGKDDAVYRDRPEKIISIHPNPMPSDFYKFTVKDDDGYEWSISGEGRLFNTKHEDENDVFLIEKE